MRLFITIEAQNAVSSGITQVVNDVNQKLSFITNNDKTLNNEDKYGYEFCLISIIPTCVDEAFWNALGWKERKQIWRKKKEADIRLRLDYIRFINETPDNQRLLFIDVIIKSIKIVQERSKEDFRGYLLISDILNALDVTQQELDSL